MSETKVDTSSLQGESLIALNRALADATARRVAAEGAYRQGVAVGATSDVTASTQALRQSRAALEAEYQDKRTLMKPEHPDMLSLRSRIDELNRQISRETSQASSGRSNTLLAEYRGALAAENALEGRVAALKGSVLNLRGRSIQYTILQREVDTPAPYDALLQRYKEIGVAAASAPIDFWIVDRGEFGRLFPDRCQLSRGCPWGGRGLDPGCARVLNDTIKTRDDVRTSSDCLSLRDSHGPGQDVRRGFEGPDLGRVRGLFGGASVAPVQHGDRSAQDVADHQHA